MIPVETLAECIVLRDDHLFWRNDRPKSHFNCSRGYNTWRTKYAGLRAGHLRSDGYREFTISIGNKTTTVLEHIAVMAMRSGEYPNGKVDHINGVRDDNSGTNLRIVTDAGNAKNNAKRIDNTSGVTGVCWDKQTCKWRVQGRSELVPFRPKRFADKFEAICARKSWELKEEFSSRHGTTIKEGVQ